MMNKKWAPYILIMVLGIALFFVKRCGQNVSVKSKTTTDRNKKDPASDVDRNHGFDRRVSYIEYTEHASAECSAGKSHRPK
jgi:hypothetical protein